MLSVPEQSNFYKVDGRAGVWDECLLLSAKDMALFSEILERSLVVKSRYSKDTLVMPNFTTNSAYSFTRITYEEVAIARGLYELSGIPEDWDE